MESDLHFNPNLRRTALPTTEEVRSDLDVDSLSMVEIIYAAEEKFGVSIPDEEAKNLKTVGDAVAYIERAAS
jgi:acyl carrier protein